MNRSLFFPCAVELEPERTYSVPRCTAALLAITVPRQNGQDVFNFNIGPAGEIWVENGRAYVSRGPERRIEIGVPEGSRLRLELKDRPGRLDGILCT